MFNFEKDLSADGPIAARTVQSVNQAGSVRTPFQVALCALLSVFNFTEKLILSCRPCSNCFVKASFLCNFLKFNFVPKPVGCALLC